MASLAGIRGLVVGASSPPVSGDLRARALGWWGGVRAAFQTEADERRLFLWVPVLAGAGAILYLSADREPSLVYAAIVFALAVAIAVAARAKPLAFRLAVAAAAVCGGMFCGAVRNARVAAPVVERTIVARTTGFIEEIDFRKKGARFVVRVSSIEGLAPEATPYRVRLTTRRAPASTPAISSP